MPSSVKVYQPNEVSRAIQQNEGLLLVHFGSPLASPCEFVRQELETIAPEFEEQRLHFAEVELPLQNFELIQAFGLEEVPTLILFFGSQEVERLERILLPEELKEFLDTALSYYSSGVPEVEH
ncbi:MAG: thioredoxin family protein [Planctomycetes bacterium]|nr:thioredoxin family protein [Planctomycetota bacterium]